MNVLAVDAALGAFSAAIACDNRLAASSLEPGNVALERGLAIIETAFGRSGVAHSAIDRIAVGIGPGSFTGLRIAIAYAKSLAAAWDRPLVGLSSFDLLEMGGEFDDVLTVVQGRPGVISARRRRGGEARRASGRTEDVLSALLGHVGRTLDVLGAPEDVLHALAERGIIVRCAEPRVTPAAAAAALLASTRAPETSPHALRADYGELPAVTMPKR